MGHFLAIVRLSYFTGLPRDVSINTWHFSGDSGASTAGPLIAELIYDFYNEGVSPSGNRVANMISPVVDRGALKCRLTIYDQAQAKPRRPFYDEGWTLAAASGTGKMPLEVAAVSSFQGNRQSGVPQARRRGRHFIGPLTDGTITAGTSSSMPELSTDVRDILSGAAARVVQNGSDDARWCVYSRVSGDLVPVTNGWIDTDPDTQRRREPTPRARKTWEESILP